MASLLKLPGEVRDKIIENVIQDERPPPPSPKSCEASRAKAVGLKYGEVRSWHSEHVRYDENDVKSNSAGLLWTNRHLREQTQSAIARTYPDGLTYKLDVMIVDEKEFWPTWLCVPASTTRVKEMNVTFRIFGANTDGRGNLFRGGDGGPPQIVWPFYYLLEHFLDYGITNPIYTEHLKSRTLKTGEVLHSKEFTEGGTKVRVSARSIRTNFIAGDPTTISPDTEDAQEKWEDRQDEGRRRRWQDRDEDDSAPETDAPLAIHPKSLAQYIAGPLQGVVAMGYHTAEFRGIVNERVGQFIICAEGERIREIETGEYLAHHSAEPEADDTWSNMVGCQWIAWYSKDTFGHLTGDCRVLSFWNWKFLAVKQRQALGLSMPADVVWPTLEEMTKWRHDVAEYRRASGTRGCGSACRPARCLCADHELEDWLRSKRTHG